MRFCIFLPFLILFSLNILEKASAKCYFPGELQGVWATQAAPDVLDAPIAYAMVTIDANYISTWGQCYAKIDGNIILADRSGPRSAPCFRCFRLVVASVNVAALVGANLNTCFSSVEDALDTCPTTERGSTHIVLYKVRTSWGTPGLQETQCPFSGVYFFSLEKGHRNNRRERRRMRCEQPTSEMSNCPFGFSLSLQYRDCSFQEPRAASWHCLGSWKGLDGNLYTTVLDTYAKEGDGNPKYKCGMYKEDVSTGRIFLTFSQDSTCTNGLISAENGHERYILHSTSTSPLPASVREKHCRFPSSLRGRWHNTIIGKTTITYKDDRNFDTLHMQCVREFGDSERYAVYTRTDCGKWFFTCVLIKRRSANIIEILFGEISKDTLHPHLCDVRNFGNQSSWVTQAKTNIEVPTSCPIVGTYKGELPDSPGYCAQLFSDCTRTDLMYYAVDECSNPNSIYERTPFPQPLEVTPGVYIPPERFDNRRTTNVPAVFPERKGQSFVNIPREIQVGTINILPGKTRTNLQNSVYDSTSVHGPALVITKRKRREAQQNYDALYNIRNPKTTTISFAWGKGNSYTTTTSNPPLIREDHQNKFISRNQPPLRGTQNNDPYGNSQRFQPNSWNPNNFRYPESIQDSSGRSPYHPIAEQQTSQRLPQPSHHAFNRDFDRTDNSDLGFPRTNQGGFPLSGGNPRHPQDLPETRENRVRALPIGSNFNVDDPLGFWPDTQDKINHNLNNGFPPHVTKNEPRPPLLNERPIPLDDSLWRGPPSPSPSMRDISASSTTPLPLHHDINNNPNTNIQKRKPAVEEREYQCIGQWEENGVIYALTQRRDIHTYECFVGISTPQGVVYVKEAGSFCSRSIKPDEFGMKTVIKEECIEESSRSSISDTFAEKQDGWRGSRWITSRARETSPTRPSWVPTTTRPWKPITGRPRRRNSSDSVQSSNVLIYIILIGLYIINSFL